MNEVTLDVHQFSAIMSELENMRQVLWQIEASTKKPELTIGAEEQDAVNKLEEAGFYTEEEKEIESLLMVYAIQHGYAVKKLDEVDAQPPTEERLEKFNEEHRYSISPMELTTEEAKRIYKSELEKFRKKWVSFSEAVEQERHPLDEPWPSIMKRRDEAEKRCELLKDELEEMTKRFAGHKANLETTVKILEETREELRISDESCVSLSNRLAETMDALAKLKSEKAERLFNQTKLTQRITEMREDGNWNCNEFMHGKLVGLLEAMALTTDTVVNYPAHPGKYLDDADAAAAKEFKALGLGVDPEDVLTDEEKRIIALHRKLNNG